MIFVDENHFGKSILTMFYDSAQISFLRIMEINFLALSLWLDINRLVTFISDVYIYYYIWFLLNRYIINIDPV